MNIQEIRIQTNAIIERLNVIERLSDVKAKKKMLNQIHSAADEIMELVDYALLKLQ